jgi:hypothetical protein
METMMIGWLYLSGVAAVWIAGSVLAANRFRHLPERDRNIWRPFDLWFMEFILPVLGAMFLGILWPLATVVGAVCGLAWLLTRDHAEPQESKVQDTPCWKAPR